MTGDSTPGAALGATLRAWRDRLSPAAAGLPPGRSRRATGLRREELADLSGLSVDYVVRLEQGRATTPSAQVVAALARALQLSTAERDHLFSLARLAPPDRGEIDDHIPPGVHRVLHRLGDVAVAVFAADWELVWWNRGWSALLGDPASSEGGRWNFARFHFPVAGRPPVTPHWPVVSTSDSAVRAAVVSDLRSATGRHPHSVRLRRLIADLRAGNADFAALWSAGAVGAHREDHKVVHHPSVGPVTVDCDVLTDGDAALKIVVMTAAPDTPDETSYRLALVAGAATPAGR